MRMVKFLYRNRDSKNDVQRLNGGRAMKMKYEHIHNCSRNNGMMGINELEGIELDYGDDDFGDELLI